MSQVELRVHTLCCWGLLAWLSASSLGQGIPGFRYDFVPPRSMTAAHYMLVMGPCGDPQEADFQDQAPLSEFGPNLLGRYWALELDCSRYEGHECPGEEADVIVDYTGNLGNCYGLAGATQAIAFSSAAGAEYALDVVVNKMGDPWAIFQGDGTVDTSVFLPFRVTDDGMIRVQMGHLSTAYPCPHGECGGDDGHPCVWWTDGRCEAGWSGCGQGGLGAACGDDDVYDGDPNFPIGDGPKTFRGTYDSFSLAAVAAAPRYCFNPACDCGIAFGHADDFIVFLRYYQESFCEGDANGDRVVDEVDLGLVLSAWESFLCPPSVHYNPDADLDGNGHVWQSDLALVIGNWGPCP